ncbi:MAG: tpl protein [Coriobacteriaceae bacterium]|nr:tpl protein [Coriobacteriaceae bacterium]
MPTIVGVRLRNAAKVLWFDPAGNEPAVHDRVIVRTERGEEIGEVAEASHEVESSALRAPLKPVLRVATAHDLEKASALTEREGDAMKVYREVVKKHGLDMKPTEVEFLFDGSKAVLYFVAEERVDFRELVKELSSRLDTRVDMRQIGVRDEARMVGGLGHCGEQLCCVRFGGEFQPVSIRMAKEQDLPLNPLKISGLCGRLMCCLRYEYDAYKDFKGRAPKRGAMIETPVGDAKVVDLNTPREMVTLSLPEGGGQVKLPLEALECGKGAGCPCRVNAEAFEAARAPALPSAFAAAARDEQASAPAAEPAPSRSRKRRERKPGGDRSSEKSAPKQEQKAAASPPEKQAEQAKPQAPSGRRRRRRRSSGGGGGGGAGAPGV